ncbi:MAG: YdcF family protein [Candidatus Cyclobacteriaceae bacterium M2_1C_046]
MANKPYDAIIVPGYPFQDSTWHDVMKIRVYWSKYLFENGYTNNVIYSGSAVYTPFIESVIMREYGKALGIPKENIFVEMEAEHSTENLYYSVQLAENLGFKKIALATDPFQNSLLKRFAKKNDLNIDFLPIVFDTLKHIPKPTPEINYSVAYVQDFEALPDKENFWKRFRGTLGGNINPDLYEYEITKEEPDNNL